MEVGAYRRARGLTLEQFAEALKLKPGSAGHLSRIENGATASIPLALKVEAISDGEVPAESLLTDEDAALLVTHRRLVAERRGVISLRVGEHLADTSRHRALLDSEIELSRAEFDHIAGVLFAAAQPAEAAA